jgi:hypothetical protein
MNGGVSMKCPYCQSRAIARTSKAMSLTLREIIYSCRNHECGASWAASLEATRLLSPSSMPNPHVRLPLSPHIRAAELISQIISSPQLKRDTQPP